MLKAILLDIDGTLVVSNDAHAQAWMEALQRFGFQVSPDRVRRWIGMGGDKILPRVDASLDDESEPGVSIVKLRQRIFLDQYVEGLRPTAGAVELLEGLRGRNLLRVAATSANKTEFAAIVSAAGIQGYIDLATTSDDADRSKPDADIVCSALAKARAAAAEAIYLGDTPYDVSAAHKAGVAVIALRCGGWNTRDLAAADALYDTPAHLLEHLDESLGKIEQSTARG